MSIYNAYQPFQATWGALGAWSAQANVPFTPNANQWGLHVGNSLFPSSVISPSTLMQANGQIKIPYSGMYILDLSVNTKVISYTSGLKAAFLLTSTSTLNGTYICVINIQGESDKFGSLDASRKIYLNAGDLLSPSFLFKDDLLPVSPSTPNANMTISVGFMGNTSPMTIANLSNTGVLQNSSFCSILILSAIVGANGAATFFLTNNGTKTGNSVLSKYFGSVFSAIPASGTISSATSTPFSTSNGSISQDLKTITVVTITGNTIATLLAGAGATFIYAPAGTVVTGYIFCQLL